MDHDPPNEKRREGEFAAPPTPTFESGKTLDASIVDSAQLEAKQLATLAAELARLGAQLHELRGGAYLIAVGGACRHFDDLSACRQFYRQIGGRS